MDLISTYLYSLRKINLLLSLSFQKVQKIGFYVLVSWKHVLSKGLQLSVETGILK